ncbi:hypothetical protein KI387_014221, partial [Taxus chinensis]
MHVLEKNCKSFKDKRGDKSKEIPTRKSQLVASRSSLVIIKCKIVKHIRDMEKEQDCNAESKYYAKHAKRPGIKGYGERGNPKLRKAIVLERKGRSLSTGGEGNIGAGEEGGQLVPKIRQQAMANCSSVFSSSTINSIHNLPFKGYGTFTKYYRRPGLKGHGRQRKRSTLSSIAAISSVSTSVIDARIATAKSTGRLDLSECGLSEVPKEVFYILDLEDLSLSGNNISIIPNEIRNLKKLCRLGLAGNRLEELPASIGELKQLKGLWVHGNILTYLPNEIGGLVQLCILALAGNKLKGLPNTVMDLSNLQVLSVCGNCLETIPPGIGCLRSLKSLALYGNQLWELPESLAHLSSLQELWLQ